MGNVHKLSAVRATYKDDYFFSFFISNAPRGRERAKTGRDQRGQKFLVIFLRLNQFDFL